MMTVHSILGARAVSVPRGGGLRQKQALPQHELTLSHPRFSRSVSKPVLGLVLAALLPVNGIDHRPSAPLPAAQAVSIAKAHPSPHRQLLNYALAELEKGVSETAQGPYGKDYIINTYQLPTPDASWCALFVSEMLHRTLGEYPWGETPHRYSRNIKRWAVGLENGQYIPNTQEGRQQVQPGFLIFYRWPYEDRTEDWTNHIGIVERVDGDNFIVIEGNEVGPYRGVKRQPDEPERLGAVRRMVIPKTDPTINCFVNPFRAALPGD